MDIQTLLNLPTLYMPTLSKDGAKLAFYTETLDLAVLELATDTLRPVPLGGAIPTRPLPFQWDDTGQHIYFSRDAAGTEHYSLYRVAVTTGAVQRLTNAEGVADYALDSHGEMVLFGSNRAGAINLYALNLATWAIRQLTAYAQPVMDAIFSPDGTQILYTVNTTDSPRNVDVWVMDADGDNQRLVLQTEVGVQDGFSDWVGQRIAVHSDAGGVRRSGVLDIRSGKLKWLSPRTGNYWPGRLSPDGRYLLSYLNQDAAIQPVLIETASGKLTSPKLPMGVYYGGQWLNAHEFAITVEADTVPRQVIRYHLGQRRQSPVLRPADVAPKHFTPHEYIHYPSADRQIPALFYKPQGSGPFPAVVYLHGGPTAQFFRDFDPLAQAFTMEGFAVLMPNVRGSTGYGLDFRDAIVADWGGPDLRDTVAAAAYLKSRPDIQPDNVGVYGGSYGGFLVYLALTKAPTIFAAGVALNGITDLVLLDQTADPHYADAVRRYMGDPNQRAALWADRSAVHFADQLQAPLLMLHAANDPRCPVSQAQVFAQKLLAAGKIDGQDFWLNIWEDEGHSRADVSSRQRTVAQLLTFFTAHLK